MKPTTPVLTEDLQKFEVVYAEKHKEYIPLPVHRNEQGVVLSRWTLTDSEREAVAAGADIFLSVHTFNQPLQPLRIEVAECDRDLIVMAEEMGLFGK